MSKEFIEYVNEAYENMARHIISTIYESNSNEYSNLKRKCFDISTGIDMAVPIVSADDIFYSMMDDVCSVIQSNCDNRANTLNCREYFGGKQSDRIKDAICRVHNNKELHERLSAYHDTAENWAEILAHISELIKREISYADVAGMALTKTNVSEYDSDLHDFYSDCLNRGIGNNDIYSFVNINKCAQVADDIKNGIAYDVYHELFDGNPTKVQSYIPKEDTFVKKIDVLLRIEDPLVTCTSVDYTNETHISIKYRIYKAMYISENAIFPKTKYGDGDFTAQEIDEFLKLCCLDRKIFTNSWLTIWEQRYSNKNPSHYYLYVEELIDQYKEAIKHFSKDRQRTQTSYDTIPVDNVSLFRIMKCAEDIKKFAEGCQAVEVLAILSCPNSVYRTEAKKCNYGDNIYLCWEQNEKNETNPLKSTYKRKQEIKAIIRAASTL